MTGSPAASTALASPPELAKKNCAKRVSRKSRSPIATSAGSASSVGRSLASPAAGSRCPDTNIRRTVASTSTTRHDRLENQDPEMTIRTASGGMAFGGRLGPAPGEHLPQRHVATSPCRRSPVERSARCLGGPNPTLMSTLISEAPGRASGFAMAPDREVSGRVRDRSEDQRLSRGRGERSVGIAVRQVRVIHSGTREPATRVPVHSSRHGAAIVNPAHAGGLLTFFTVVQVHLLAPARAHA